MKKNMKKLASLLFMAMLVLGLTACGSTGETTETVVDAAYAESVSQFFVANITQMPEEDIQYYIELDAEDLQEMLDQSAIPVKAEAFQDVLSGYSSDLDVYGEYVSTDSYDLKGDDEEATHTTNLTFATHPATITLVFDEDGVVTTGSIDPVYTMGEILEKAALNTVIGMGTVFIVLIFISWLIGLLPKLTGLIEGTGKKKEEAPAPKKAPVPAPAPAAPVATPQVNYTDDLALVAVISAAIAAYTGTSTDGFVVRSIKRSTTNKWKKA